MSINRTGRPARSLTALLLGAFVVAFGAASFSAESTAKKGDHPKFEAAKVDFAKALAEAIRKGKEAKRKAEGGEVRGKVDQTLGGLQQLQGDLGRLGDEPREADVGELCDETSALAAGLEEMIEKNGGDAAPVILGLVAILAGASRSCDRMEGEIPF